MKTITRALLTTSIIITCFIHVSAQSLPVGTPVVDEYYRRAQLLGNQDTLTSFTVRPIFPSVQKGIFFPDSMNYQQDPRNHWVSRNGKMKASLLPFSFQTQGNSDHPYGWNDGAMIPAKGFQAMASIGGFVQLGPLTIQLRPEIVSAQNQEFETLSASHYDVIFARYYDIYNNIDLPVRFGTRPYQQIFWGQSSVRFNVGGFSAGISTENLWWGPGIRNSLLMSNTAPGFMHWTINTRRPVKTPIGTFEGMLIGGNLQNSGFPPLIPDKTYFGTNLYVPKPNEGRYLSGLVITWQPKWISGLFLGFDQSQQLYRSNMNSIKDFLPVFSSIKGTYAPDNPIGGKDQVSSVFMRWLWREEHAEMYFQFGKYNNKQDFQQELLNPSNARAYIFGLRKLIPFKKTGNEYILIGIEVTQLQNTSLEQLAKGQGWYISQNIRYGYTNLGQSLGAGTGPGSNIQSVEFSWVKGIKKLGLQLERYVQNNDFYYYAFQDSRDYTRHWVNLSASLTGEWDYKNFIFNAKATFVDALNYQWALSKPGNDIRFENQTQRFNLQLLTGVTYRF